MGNGWKRNTHGCPCGTCADRASGERESSCHDGCERYKAWKKKLEEVKETQRKEILSANTLSEKHQREIWKRKRYSNQAHFNNSWTKN